jgi:tetratricopeptide (TPR) repeat protein
MSAAQALGLSFDYSADRHADLRSCDSERYRGRLADAERCYAALLAESDDARLRAEAAWSRGDLRAANAHFQTAIKLHPDDPRVRSRWGELFVATHQDSEAVKLFQEALELDADHLPAKLGLASVSVGRFEDRARAWAEEVLDADPEQLKAHLLLARMDLEDGQLSRAAQALGSALSIAESKGLPPLEVYALNASADLLRGITDSPWTERALAYNPGFGDIYATPAHFYVITRRYREAIELLFEAVRIQPELWSAHAELGVNLLRENRVEEARAHLTIAYQGDPFSAKIVNTLRLIDSFDHFRIVTREPDGEDPLAGAGIIMRLHEDEVDVLEPYVADLVTESIRTFSERYQFELTEPVVVELYPEHDDFAVRTSGLPGIGLLGVTFGYLVAMDSPSGGADTDFHWGTTLWHEMAHVFTLEATDHLVPRWFSEGASVFEEWSTGPRPGRHVPLHVLEAMQEDRFLPVAELDSGFIRPTYQGQVMVSYMQAGLICQHIEQTWGRKGLVDMLRYFRDGLDTPEVIRQALGLAPEVFDAGFDAFLEREFGAVLEGLAEWREQTEDAHEALAAENWGGVIESAEAAIALHPGYVDENNAYVLKARAQDALEQRPAAMETLQGYWRRGGYEPRVLHRLAEWLDEAGRTPEALAVLADVIYAAPLDEDLHARLGDWWLAQQQASRALLEYQVLLAMNPHDQAAAHYRLATAYLQLEDLGKTREHLLYALETAPHYREAQQLLLEIVR